jgi:hypothetical protein
MRLPTWSNARLRLPLFRGRTDLYSQLLPRDAYLGLYAELSGFSLEPDVLRFWTVLGLAKAATVHIAAARAFEDGRTNDLRLAALGHQAVHVLRILTRELGQ